MRPIPPAFLLGVILALCGLCATQWYRESTLRKLAIDQHTELLSLRSERAELLAHAKSADAEILTLNGSLGELRSNSISKDEHENALADFTEARESIVKQNETLVLQNERITLQNGALVQASGAIDKANLTLAELTLERDGLAKKFNDLTTKYNKLATSR